VLRVAPAPTLAAGLSRSKIESALRRGGRQRRVDERAGEIQAALRAEQLQAPAVVATAMGASVAATVAVISKMNSQIARLAGELEAGFEQRVRRRAEPLSSAKSRKNYAGTSPITRASGTKRVVLARHVPQPPPRGRHLPVAFASLNASPRSPQLLHTRRAAGDTHHQALRALANRLVGILHGCLEHHSAYDETIAWGHRTEKLAVAA
jgi:hypothetical protein